MWYDSWVRRNDCTATVLSHLQPLTERRDGQIGICRRSRAARVWIERERNT